MPAACAAPGLARGFAALALFILHSAFFLHKCLAADVLWQSETFTGTPLSNRLVYITPIANYSVSGSRIISGDRQCFTNDATGSLIVSNLTVARSYRVEFIGPYVTTIITNSFPANVTGYVNAADFVAGQVSDGNFVGYSQATADSRFHKTSAGSSTNASFRGTLKIPDGATAGYVFTVTNADGSGAWQPAAGGADAPTVIAIMATNNAASATTATGISGGALNSVQAINTAGDSAGTNSFAGNGIGLTNIPRSGVTGLESALAWMTNQLPVFDAARYGALADDDIDDTVALQRAIDAAGLAGGGQVNLSPGRYLLCLSNALYPLATSEDHPSALVITNNNIRIKGAGGFATELFLTSVTPYSVANFIGSGGSAAASDPSDYAARNIKLEGFMLDAANLPVECTQLFGPTNWLLKDLVMYRSGSVGFNYDGYDIQGEYNFVIQDCWAIDCYGNGIGAGSPSTIVDGLYLIRCGAGGGLSSAMQFTYNPPPKLRRVFAIDCNMLLSPSSFIDISDSYLSSTNTGSQTNFIFASPYWGRFNNCEFSFPAANTVAMLVNGGTVELNNCRLPNNTIGISVTSGNLTVQDSYIGFTGIYRPITISGATSVRILNNKFAGSSTYRDLSVGSAALAIIRGNDFLGDNGVIMDGSTVGIFENNYSKGTVNTAANVRMRNNYLAGSLLYNGGGASIQDNVIVGDYLRSAGDVTVFGGNHFVSPSATTIGNLTRAMTSFTSITPTATQTLWTNTVGYPVQVYWYGGAVEAVGRNGNQIKGSGDGSTTLATAEYVGITNSNTSGLAIKYHPAR